MLNADRPRSNWLDAQPRKVIGARVYRELTCFEVSDFMRAVRPIRWPVIYINRRLYMDEGVVS